MAGTSRETSSVITSATNSYNTRLDSSVRIKTRIRTEVTQNRIRANAHNSGHYETRDNARRTDRASASISCEHCRSSRNNPNCAPRHVIYYCFRVMIFWRKKTFSSQKRGLHNEYQLYIFNVYGITMYSCPLRLYCKTLNITKNFYSVLMTNWLCLDMIYRMFST